MSKDKKKEVIVLLDDDEDNICETEDEDACETEDDEEEEDFDDEKNTFDYKFGLYDRVTFEKMKTYFEPYELNKTIQVQGGYEHVYSNAEEFLKHLGLKNKKMDVSTLQDFIEVLQSYWWKTETADVQLDDRNRHVFNLLNEVIRDLSKRNHLNNSDIVLKEACSSFVCTLQNVASYVSNEAEERRSILWLGQTGIGKSFNINLLLFLSENYSWDYEETSLGKQAKNEVRLQRENIKKGSGKKINFKTIDRKIFSNWVSSNNKFQDPLFKSYFICIKPGPEDFSNMRNQQNLELEALQFLRQRNQIGDERQFLNFIKKRGNHFPGYLLTSAGRTTFFSTTRHLIHIHKGSHWHFTVTYKSLEEIHEEFWEYDYNEMRSKELKGAQEKKHHYMEMLLAALQGRAKEEEGEEVESTKKARLDEEADPDSVEYQELEENETSKFYPKTNEEIRDLTEEVKLIAGKTLLFVGEGKNSLKDRIHIRRMLHSVLFEGIGSTFPPPPGTEINEGEFISTPVSVTVDRHIIKRVDVFVPCEHLLAEDVEWIDAPGTNDGDDEKFTNTLKGLEECTGLMVFSSSTLEAQDDVGSFLKETIWPRFWSPNSSLTRFGYFFLQEKSYRESALDLANARKIQVHSMKKVKEKTMKDIANQIVQAKIPDSTLDQADVHKNAWRMLNMGFFNIYPFMYSSILCDWEQRLCLSKLPPSSSFKTIREGVSIALTHSYGRKFVDGIRFVAESQMNVAFDELKHQSAKMKKKLDDIKQVEPRVFSSTVQDWAKNQKKLLGTTAGNFRTNYSSQKTKEFLEKQNYSEFGDSFGVEKYIESIKSLIKDKIKKLSEKKENPCVFAENLVSIRSLRGLFTGAQTEVLDLTMAFDKVSKTFKEIYEDVKTIIKEYMTTQFLPSFSQVDKDDITKQVEVLLDGTFLVENLKYNLGNEMKLALTEESAKQEIQSQIFKKWKRIVDKNLVDLAKKKMKIFRTEAEKEAFKGKSVREKIQFLDHRVNECLGGEFSAEVVDVVNNSLAELYHDHDKTVAAKLFNYQKGIISTSLRMLFEALSGIKAKAKTKQKFKNQIEINATALSYLKIQIRNIEQIENLNTKDALFFECWCKAKFLLEDFFREHPGVVTLVKNPPSFCSGLRTSNVGAYDMECDKSKLALKVNHNEDSNQVIEGDKSFAVIVGEEIDQKPGTCKVLYIGESNLQTKHFHEFISKANSPSSTLQNLLQAIQSCLKPRRCRMPLEILKVWRNLGECVFPNQREEFVSEAAKKIFSIKGRKSPIAISDEVFEDWFNLSMDEYLQEAYCDPNSRFVTPVLLGAAEMLGTPILVQVYSKVYIIEPLLREGERDEYGRYSQGYQLKWSHAKGFEAMPLNS